MVPDSRCSLFRKPDARKQRLRLCFKLLPAHRCQPWARPQVNAEAPRHSHCAKCKCRSTASRHSGVRLRGDGVPPSQVAGAAVDTDPAV